MIKTSYAIGITFICMLVLTMYFENIMDENYVERNRLQNKINDALDIEKQLDYG